MKKIIGILLIIISLTNCTDILKEDNKGGINNDEFYKTAIGYETLITSSYATLRTIYGDVPWLLLAGTDIYQKTRQNDYLSLYEYSSLFPSDENVLQFYSDCYKSIQIINTAIYYNETPIDISEAKRKTYKAELRFLRAFYHFLLIEQFGGISINDQITLFPRTDMKRNDLSECYDFIISEIEDCVNDLDKSTVGRVNQDCANHYLAKIYLTRGWDLKNDNDFNIAKVYAKKVIDSKEGITIPYKNLWSPKNENNAEILFAVQYDISSIASFGLGNSQQALFGPYFGGAEVNQKIMKTELIPSWNLHMWYTENDARYDASFMLIAYENYFDDYNVADKSALKVRSYFPRVWNHSYTSEELNKWKSSHNILPSFVCYPFIEDEELYRTDFQTINYTPCVKKFDSPASANYSTVNSKASVRDIVLARLAETYFLYAEACIGLKDYTTAATYVQTVLDRPGNATTGVLTNGISGSTNQQEALNSYLIESGKEFIGEYNGRWPELRRTRMLKYMLERYNYDVKHLGITLDFEKYSLRPIPEDAITLNDAINDEDQNPGY